MYKIKNILTSETFALKVSSFSVESTNGVPAEIIREINTNKIVKHDFIVELFAVQIGAEHVYLTFELMDMDLQEFITQGLVNPVFTKFCMRALICGVAEMHRNGLVHRDLKPGNILVNKNQVKIGDLGFSREFLGRGRRYTSKIGGRLTRDAFLPGARKRFTVLGI